MIRRCTWAGYTLYFEGVEAIAKRLAPIYLAAGWRWAKEDQLRVPTEEDIQKAITDFFDNRVFDKKTWERFADHDHDTYHITSGGLELFCAEGVERYFVKHKGINYGYFQIFQEPPTLIQSEHGRKTLSDLIKAISDSK